MHYIQLGTSQQQTNVLRLQLVLRKHSAEF